MVQILNVNGFYIVSGETAKDALLSHLRRGRTLHFLNLRGLDLSDSDWSNVDFGESDLTGTNLRFCNLVGVNFYDFILEKTDLRGSKFDFGLEAILQMWPTCRHQPCDKSGQLLLFPLSA